MDHFFPKLRLPIKDNNRSPHRKFDQFLFPFSSKFPDLNFASYVPCIYLCSTHRMPGLPVDTLDRWAARFVNTTLQN